MPRVPSTSSTVKAKQWLRSNHCKAADRGVVVEGTVVEKRLQSVFVQGDSDLDRSELDDKLPTRFLVVVVKSTALLERCWKDDSSRHEDTELNYMLKDERAGCSVLTADEVHKRIQLPAGLYDESKAKRHPATAGTFELWADETRWSEKLVEVGDSVRVCTDGNSHLAAKLGPTTATTNIGVKGQEAVGAEWAGTITAHHEGDEKASDNRQGADEDEWSD